MIRSKRNGVSALTFFKGWHAVEGIGRPPFLRLRRGRCPHRPVVKRNRHAKCTISKTKSFAWFRLFTGELLLHYDMHPESARNLKPRRRGRCPHRPVGSLIRIWKNNRKIYKKYQSKIYERLCRQIRYHAQPYSYDSGAEKRKDVGIVPYG